jgi:hypothetical protein
VTGPEILDQAYLFYHEIVEKVLLTPMRENITPQFFEQYNFCQIYLIDSLFYLNFGIRFKSALS